MPPGRRSSSSSSSRSRSSSSRSRSSSSRRRSSSSHSSSYRRSYSSSRSTSTVSSGRVRRNQPTGIPSHVRQKSVLMRCKNHDYMYYNEAWTDEKTGASYRKGYYDENGTYYDADSIVFKKPDGSYEAHYMCDYCGTELEADWKEGFYPTCQNCGAEMNKTPVYIDEIINVGTREASYPSYSDPSEMVKNVSQRLLKSMLISFALPIVMIVIMFSTIVKINRETDAEFDRFIYTESTPAEEYDPVEETETNLEIYGTDIYLDEISPDVYRICDEEEDYEKHITWDYGARSYYDYDSDCYLWYNTDVSPNLWQYWYDDIAGDNYYGWMECEGEDWYMEVSDTDWELYEGDTDGLWHIENSFD